MVEPLQKQAHVRRCIVRYRRSLLAQGVASMLASNPGIEVVLVDADKTDLMKAVQNVRPEALILDINDCNDLGSLLATLLRDWSEMKIVCLDPVESVVHILQPAHYKVERASDLISTLRDAI